VNREWFTTRTKVAIHPDTKKKQHVVQTSVSLLHGINLSVVEDYQDDDLSHALIPEINSLDYKNDKEKKKWIKYIARKIALDLCEMVYICPTNGD